MLIFNYFNFVYIQFFVTKLIENTDMILSNSNNREIIH